jgi:hypothetical protein
VNGGVARALALGILLMMVLCVIGLIAYARGPEHHHGDDVGALGGQVSLVATA